MKPYSYQDHSFDVMAKKVAELETRAADDKGLIDELVCMLERGYTGTSGLLIQTSDQSAVIQWRKESQELINKIRSE